MSTETEGFPSGPEPALDLASFAEMELLRERLYAAQNAVVRLEGERDGKVREVLLSFAAELEAATEAPGRDYQASYGFQRAARLARERAERDGAATASAPVADAEQAQSPGAPEGAQGRRHLNPCTRCNGSGSEPDTDPDEAAGLVLVSRQHVRTVLAFAGGDEPADLDLACSGLADAAGADR